MTVSAPLLVFDLDGTLAETVGDLMLTLNHILGREGVPSLTAEEGRRIVGQGSKALIRAAYAKAGRNVPDDRLETLFRDFLALMTENPLAITVSVHLLFCVKNIERMGDHATNMAEAIYYMVKGEALSRERPKADVVSGLSLATGELGEDWLASAAALPSTGLASQVPTNKVSAALTIIVSE